MAVEDDEVREAAVVLDIKILLGPTHFSYSDDISSATTNLKKFSSDSDIGNSSSKGVKRCSSLNITPPSKKLKGVSSSSNNGSYRGHGSSKKVASNTENDITETTLNERCSSNQLNDSSVPASEGGAVVDTGTVSNPPPDALSSSRSLESRGLRTASSESFVNYETNCQVCQKDQNNLAALEKHLVNCHFYTELKHQFRSLMKQDTCLVCKSEFKREENLVMHIGTKHGKVNDILKSRGLAVLPCAVSNSIAPNYKLQRNLIAIKKEKAQTEELKCDEIKDEVGSKNIDLQSILSKYLK